MNDSQSSGRPALFYPSQAWEAAMDHFIDYAVHTALAQAWAVRLSDDAAARAAADLARKEYREMLEQLVNVVCDPDFDVTKVPTAESVYAQTSQDVITRLAAHVVRNSVPLGPARQAAPASAETES